MFCRNCGKEMQDKSSVCIYCGVKKIMEINIVQTAGVKLKN